jgi:glycosyltransferase involved in cell wall biosynthesis
MSAHTQKAVMNIPNRCSSNSFLRIGIDINTLRDGYSGIQTYLSELLNQLQKIDNRNEYVLFETSVSDYDIFNSKWKKVLLPSFNLPGIVLMQLIFPLYLSRYKIDILWSPKFTCPLWQPKRTKYFTTIHDLTPFRFPETMLFKDKLFLRLLIPLSVKRSTAVVTDSYFIKNDIDKYFSHIKTPVCAIPLGKPFWNIPSGYRSEARGNFLFFAGNFEPRKNILNTIKALELLHAEGKTIELQVASPAGWKNRELLDYIERSPIKSNIKLLGFISTADLQQKYLSCNALVYPSYYEGFGRPVLEALTMDCMVITSINTVMQEITGESALYFNPFDPNDIAEKIKYIFSDVFNRDFYLKHKNIILKNYSWEIAARKLLAVFES